MSQHDHLISKELLDKMPPSDQGAEQAVLGSVLLDPGKWNVVYQMIQSRHFYDLVHIKIFKAIERCVSTHNSIFDQRLEFCPGSGVTRWLRRKQPDRLL